jgi:hypothetical protein
MFGSALDCIESNSFGDRKRYIANLSISTKTEITTRPRKNSLGKEITPSVYEPSWIEMAKSTRHLQGLSKTSLFQEYRLSPQSVYSSVFKDLFISQTNSEKSFCLEANVAEAGRAKGVGKIVSQDIKIISKPTKKRANAKATDCIISFHWLTYFSVPLLWGSSGFIQPC